MFKNRIKNVLYSTFAISWALVNWEFLFVLVFSNDEPRKTLVVLDGMYSTWEAWGWFLGIPLGLTALHIFIFSRVSEWVYRYWLEHVRRLSDTRKKIEGATLLDVEESEKIRGEAARLRLEVEENKKTYIEELSALENRHKANIKKVTKKHSEELSELKKSQEKVTSKDEVMDSNPQHPVKPKLSDVLKEVAKNKWNILKQQDYRNIIQIHEQGVNEYSCRVLYDRTDPLNTINNFKNIMQTKGISLTMNTQARYANIRITWERSRFQ